MMIFITVTISPIVAPTFLLKNIANTSVPSITAPPRIAKPIPAPRKKPPKIATNKLSSVTFGKVTNARTRDRAVIASMVLIINAFPNTLYASMINGILTKTINKGKGISVRADINKEIPVAPPSINLFVRRKPLKPKAGEKS